jgi:hypothetical protein
VWWVAVGGTGKILKFDKRMKAWIIVADVLGGCMVNDSTAATPD